MGTAHAKLAAAGMVEGAHTVEVQTCALRMSYGSAHVLSAFSAVVSSRLFRRRGAQNKAKPNTTPCAAPDGFLRTKDDGATAKDGTHDECGESCGLDQRLKQDQRLLLDLFESAKQAGAVRDTSNEDHADWKRAASSWSSSIASRTSSRTVRGTV